MKIKLDENLPRRAGPILVAAGHDVDSVEDEGLAGSDDPAVSLAATAAGRLVITLDRGFGDIQRSPPGSHAGILVLRVDDHPPCRSSTRSASSSQRLTSAISANASPFTATAT